MQERNTDTLTNSIQTVPVAEAIEEHKTGWDGLFLFERVISTISPVVVRQDDPAGPRYQEALGYAFLVNGPKYPALVRMDDGKLVLTMSAALSPPSKVTGPDDGRTTVILYSDDDGMSWSQPRRIDGYRTTPMNLGGSRLMLRGWTGTNDDTEPFALWFSDDCGETWSEPELVPNLSGDRKVYTDVPLNFVIENGIVRFLFFTQLRPGTAVTLMRSYDSTRHEWGEPFFFPESWHTSEASLIRAANGDLVAAFRSSRPGIPAPSDHWRSIITSRSTDDGKTWSEPDVHFLYGYVHESFLGLPDGRIVLTYAARLGELDGRLYHGIEAVLSHDNGITWDWERRFILFRGTEGCMHSPQSVLLSDGRILTTLMHVTSFTWNDGTVADPFTSLGHVNAVIWSPE